jgi:hypothetical protein
LYPRPVPEAQRRVDELIEKMAEEIAKRGLVTPAILLLEAGKPLSFVGSQALLLLEPVLGTFWSHDLVAEIACLLEGRDNVERLLDGLEARSKG